MNINGTGNIAFLAELFTELEFDRAVVKVFHEGDFCTTSMTKNTGIAKMVDFIYFADSYGFLFIFLDASMDCPRYGRAYTATMALFKFDHVIVANSVSIGASLQALNFQELFIRQV